MGTPAAVYGLEVPCGNIVVPAIMNYPATFRITMAAIDPSAPAEVLEGPNGELPPRATLKIIREPIDADEDDEEDSDDEEYLKALLAGSDEDLSDEEGAEKNGGPSDPSKSEKARMLKAAAEIRAAAEEAEDMDVDVKNGVNGSKAKSNKGKGKGKATGKDADSDDEEEDDDEETEIEEFVLCTLDPAKNYQQPLDITINEHEQVFFKVSGTHAVFLTGNYMIPTTSRRQSMLDSDEDEDDEGDYDLSPDEDELDADEESESDELDDMEDPRIEELLSDDEAAPKTVALKTAEMGSDNKKGKNKRAAEEEPASLDDIMAKSLKPETASTGEAKLSKKQLKKLKNNAGQAVEAAKTEGDSKKSEGKGAGAGNSAEDKKVKFAKTLEQGPTGSTALTGKEAKEAKKKAAAPAESKKASVGPKVINGVTVEDKKLGSGPTAKLGDKVEMRYIGKLQSTNTQFDANKSGPPFGFKLGGGEVIKGWDIGVAGMSIGGERRMTIPPHLAYGKKKAGTIPANSTLVFDVKLLRIK